jgi:hypothetical protein
MEEPYRGADHILYDENVKLKAQLERAMKVVFKYHTSECPRSKECFEFDCWECWTKHIMEGK